MTACSRISEGSPMVRLICLFAWSTCSTCVFSTEIWATTPSLSIVMGGTGDVACMQCFCVWHGLFGPQFKYGVHIATHMAMGFLFLGGGCYMLGTSKAAIACLVAVVKIRTQPLSYSDVSPTITVQPQVGPKTQAMRGVEHRKGFGWERCGLNLLGCSTAYCLP